jgi:cytochrome P450
LTRFVEELLRNEPPVRGLSRMTTREVELGGKLLPKGSHLLVLFGSACDDDAQFESPRHFDANRKNLNKHVAFGAGIHHCIGAPLARMEIRVAAREVVHRLDNITLTVPLDSIRYLSTVASHSMERLPLTFTRSRT